MSYYAEPITRLLEELERLPGIGPKSAQRLAFHILKGDDAAAGRLADAIVEVKQRIHFCSRCFNFAADDLCEYCADPQRDGSVIVVVEEPRDVGRSFGNRSIRVGAFADAGRTAMVIESLCTSMPR